MDVIQADTGFATLPQAGCRVTQSPLKYLELTALVRELGEALVISRLQRHVYVS